VKGVIIAGFVILLAGGAALLYATIGKIIQKMFSKKGNK
jgi:hypothetical protein